MGSSSDGGNTGGNTKRPWLTPPWQPGQSGNPLGQSIGILGLAREVRRRTNNGRELVDFFMNVLEGRPIERPGRRPLTPNIDHQMAAANWLSDRGWGRPKELLEITGEATPSQRLELLRRLSDDEREQLRGLLARALSGPSVPTSDATTDGAPALAPPLEQSDSDLPPPDTAN
jgi:hypothetical protein